jgi:hypothetical protein
VALLEKLLLTPSFRDSPNEWDFKQGAPGAKIKLFGTNLNLGKVSVQFGAAPATLVDAQPNQLTVLVPILPIGAYFVTINTAGGSTTSADKFNVLQGPAFGAPGSQFSPLHGAVGSLVNLSGTDFTLQGSATPSVTFGSTPATIQGTPTDIQIGVLVPTGVSGAMTISVTVGGTTITTTDKFNVP